MDIKVDSREKIDNLFAPSGACCRYTMAAAQLQYYTTFLTSALQHPTAE
jgi:hypothetical protein